jgi:UDP-glucuronate 4-epimerase
MQLDRSAGAGDHHADQLAATDVPPGRALVTGAAGFVGSTLVDRLLADGWRVVGLDNFDGMYARADKLRNLDVASASPAFTLIEGDTRSVSAVSDAFDRAQPSVVFDLAARAGVRPSILDPVGYVDVNVRGLQVVLDAVREHGARIVFASSSSVYGNDGPGPFREDQMRARPESPYGATKIAGEALVHAHHATTGLPAAAARLFTVYGPRQRPDLAIHRFARAMLRGEPVDLYDSGRGRRDYTYVDDVVRALLLLAAVDEPYLVVNVGSDHPVTTSELVDELERALGVSADRRMAPAQPGDVNATHADVSLAAEKLGWEPRVPLRAGLEQFTGWLRRVLDQELAAAGSDVAATPPPTAT